MAELKISAVIPAFNPGPYLSEALDSVAAQTLRPFETIVIDDGSEPAIEITKDFPIPVKVIRQKNSGLAHARNVGAENACGDWIAFLDADDIWHPKKTALQADILLARPDLSCVGCRGLLMNQDGYFVGFGPGEFQGKVLPVQRKEFQISAPRAALVCSMVLVKRSAVFQVGGFDVRYRFLEDAVFYDAFFDKGLKIAILDSPLLKRRIHPQSMTFQYYPMLKGYISWLEEYVEKRSGKEFAQIVRGEIYQVVGLTALASGNTCLAKVLLKKSFNLEPKPSRLTALLFAFLGANFSSVVRGIKHRFVRTKAQRQWDSV